MKINQDIKKINAIFQPKTKRPKPATAERGKKTKASRRML